jgi:lysyl-tRNA synthetase class 2
MQDNDWQPDAEIRVLRLRAGMNAGIRAFFAERGVLEVETPVLSHAATTDPNLDSFCSHYQGPGAPTDTPLYLHTSPEFPMKRLLAAGMGPIYQICKVFRNGEAGRFHNPEFTLLEWYRPGYTHRELMVEMQDLLQALGLLKGEEGIPMLSYAALFRTYANLDPHRDTVQTLHERARELAISVPDSMQNRLDEASRDAYLDLILTHHIEPALHATEFLFVYDYPASQAALARIRNDEIPVAERFELYCRGIELANGFHELTDAREQARRFARDLSLREARGQSIPPMDHRLIAALQAGIPPCAGVAVGLDRLCMILANVNHINAALTFSFNSA